MEKTNNGQKQKIAVLGGGMAALTAIYELTNDPGWQDRYDITVYQMGWRLGGKTTTGRGPSGRIEEHGIHILQGWYDNLFRLIREVFDERRKFKLAPDNPFQEWQEAFHRDNSTLMTEFSPAENQWVNWPIIFRDNDLTPGEGGPPPVSDKINEALDMLIELLLGSPFQKRSGCLSWIPGWILKKAFGKEEEGASLFAVPDAARTPERTRPDWWATLSAEVDQTWGHLKSPRPLHFLHHSRMLAGELKSGAARNAEVPPHSKIVQLLEEALPWLRNLLEHWAARHTRFRHILISVEFGITVIKGLLDDVYDPQTHKLNFGAINHLDFREWLAQHGASAFLLCSPLVRFFYTGTFSNFHGKNGLIAAGTALHGVVMTSGYKGAFVWQFKAGTGDTLVVPLYQVLQHRGVHFRFFQKVQQVHYSETGNIEEITMEEQVRLRKDVEAYQPLIKVKNIDAWPAEPLYDQLDPEQAKALQKDKINLEMAWTSWKGASYPLKRETDFDQIILGIPIGVLGGDQGICKEIIDKVEAWKDMYDNVRTVATQSMQLWLKPGLEELGMEFDEWGLNKEHMPNLVTYANPMYSWIDMSLTLNQEDWAPDNEPATLIYYTGSLKDPAVLPPFSDSSFPQKALHEVIVTSAQWLRDNMGWFWPKATTMEWPQGLDFSLLMNSEPEKPASTDMERLERQFFRANYNPTDRYTLSLPKSAAYRLKAGASGFDNLVLTGDWIDFGLNLGYIEGAVIAGIQAANAMRERLGLEPGRLEWVQEF
jgi:uncharacterized protein with NAD-binding domain and iron-sulfur cluster